MQILKLITNPIDSLLRAMPTNYHNGVYLTDELIEEYREQSRLDKESVFDQCYKTNK